jgi:hypothetical protein
MVDESLKDCAGNSITGSNSVAMGWSEEIKKGDVIINEILFNPIGDASDFVELYNNGTNIIDVQNLKIANSNLVTGAIATTHPVAGESRLLMPGDYILLSADLPSVQEHYLVKNKQSMWGCDFPSYNDDEGEVILLTNSLMELDRFHYKASFQFPLLNDVEGISLERINANHPSSDSSNWHSAAANCGYATPGYRNSQDATTLETSDILGVSPELFTPDNDGSKDVLCIHVTPDKPGYFGSITIYNATGNIERTLIKNQLIGSSADYYWNGITANNEKAPTGIYVIYLELLHPDGTVKHLKKACVVGH